MTASSSGSRRATAASTPTRPRAAQRRRRDRDRALLLRSEPDVARDAEVDHGVHRREHGVRADTFAIAAKARNSHSSEPHIHIFPDMDFQPKFKSDTAMDNFPDGRANRGEIPGTIARGWSRRTTRSARPRQRPVDDRLPEGQRGRPAVRRRPEAARPRSEPLQHLLHAVPRLRRPRAGHGDQARQADPGRRLAGRCP